MTNVHSKHAVVREMGLSQLPLDVTMNILSRLTVKMLCKCKSVCKYWNTIISDASFLKLHRARSENNHHLFILDQYRWADDYETTQTFHMSSMNTHGELNYRVTDVACDYIDLIPSGHSLLCLVYNAHFFILNPITRQVLLLPPYAQASSFEHVDAGFGFISSRNEYKLVHLFDRVGNENDQHDIGCEILTLSLDSRNNITSEDSWQLIEAKCPFIVHGWGVCVNGVFYWMKWDGCKHKENELIVSLDLDTKQFEVIPHPHPISYHEGNDMHFVEMEGCLCLVDTFACPTVTDIWILEDPKKKIWVKKHRIDLNALEGFDDELTQITVLGYQNGEIIIRSGQERLDYYNVKTKLFSRRGPVLMNLQRDNLICLFTDSFVSLPISSRRFAS